MNARILILGRLPLHGCVGWTVLPTRAIRRQLARTLRQSGQFRGSLRPAQKVTSSAQNTSRALSTAPKQPDDSGEPIAGPSQPKVRLGPIRNWLANTKQGVEPGNEEELRESPYTLPNALTLARILACPVLGYTIVQEQFAWATGLLFACGVSDWVCLLIPSTTLSPFSSFLWPDDSLTHSWTAGSHDDGSRSPCLARYSIQPQTSSS